MHHTSNCNIKFKQDYDVYCGRGRGYYNSPLACQIGQYGWLGNPVTKGVKCFVCGEVHFKNSSTLPCYEKYLLERLKDPVFKEAFMSLKGKVLGCFCKPLKCHTDIMIKYLDAV